MIPHDYLPGSLPTIHTPTTNCRGCKGNVLREVFGIGDHHISAFPKPGEPDTPKAPLTLVQCRDCDLVQLSASVPRDVLYREYHYRSGVNPKISTALYDVVAQARMVVSLEKGDRVLDIACNDGTLLSAYDEIPDVHQIGVDPSDIADEAVRDGALPRRTIIHDYWPLTTFEMEPVPCKIITSCAVLYDVDDLDAFARAVKAWLHPDGVWVIEVADLDVLFTKNAVDVICHEHVNYFSIGVLSRWLARHDLRVVLFAHTNVNGGSLRLFVGHGSPIALGGPPLSLDMWGALAERVISIGAQTVRYLTLMKDAEKMVFGYAASTKGNTILQYFKIDIELLPAIADRQPHKWGRETVGTRIPIMSEELARKWNPSGFYVLAWPLIDTFVEREKAFLRAGGHLAHSFPTFGTMGTPPIKL